MWSNVDKLMQLVGVNDMVTEVQVNWGSWETRSRSESERVH